MEDSKFKFGGVRDALDAFIEEEFEEVASTRVRGGGGGGPQTGHVASAAAASSSSSSEKKEGATGGGAGGWGFVMMSEEERRQLMARLQSTSSAPPPALRPHWRLSHPHPQPPSPSSSTAASTAASSGVDATTSSSSAAAGEAGEQRKDEEGEAEEGKGEDEEEKVEEAAFEEEEEERLAEQGREQAWTFSFGDGDIPSSSSQLAFPFLAGLEREAPIAAPTPHTAAGGSQQRHSLFDRPQRAATDMPSSTPEQQVQSVKQVAKKKDGEEEEEEPWVAINLPAASERRPSPRMEGAAEVDKYIDEEFELTHYDKHDLKNTDALRDDVAFGKLRKGDFLSSAKARFIAQWSSVKVPQDRNRCVNQLRNDIRKGLPDSKRAQVWRTVVGCVEFERAYPNYYSDVVERVFGPKLPTRFYQIPAFGGELRPGDHYLTMQGLSAASRILWALTMEFPDVDYVPAIPDLICMLLTYLSEADAYLVTCLMLEQSRSDRWYLCLSNRTQTLFKHTFRSLIAKCLPDISHQMDILGVEVEHFAAVWFSRLFVGSLPYLTVLRIMDCYLAEGSHVLYRVGLAILQACRRTLNGCGTAQDFISVVEQVALQLEDADTLLRTAFAISFQRKHTSQFDEQNKTKLAGVSEPLYQPFNLPNITQPSELMDEIQFQALWAIIPSRYSIRDPLLLFSTTKHGFSLSSLLEKCADSKPAVLLIKDKNKRVFGAFSSMGLRLCNTFETFYGTREDFLFILSPTIKHWPYLAGHAKHFVRVTIRGMQFGDSKGLCIDEELWHGSSERSKTFENDPLSGESTEFECLSVEVWGFK